MAYLKTIETSQTWTCPKTADYKVICVAGGEGGAASSAVFGGAGASTSFGAYLTASGYMSKGGVGSPGGGGGGYTKYAYGGAGGTTSNNGVGAPTINGGGHGQSGSGYGGGGGGGGVGSRGGDGGKIAVDIVHITAGAEVVCTIGAGGASVTASASTSFPGNPGVIIIQEV